MKKHIVLTLLLIASTWSLSGVLILQAQDIAFNDRAEVAEIDPEHNRMKKTNLNAVVQIRTLLSDHLDYPALAEEFGIEGRLLVAIRVTSEGLITGGTIVESIHPLLDQQVLEVVSQIKQVDPIVINGRQRNKTVVIPVVFKS